MVDYVYGCCIYMGWCTSVVYWAAAAFMIIRPIRRTNNAENEPLNSVKTVHWSVHSVQTEEKSTNHDSEAKEAENEDLFEQQLINGYI